MIAFVLTLIFATSGFVGGGGFSTPNVISSGSDWGFIGGGDSNSIFSLGTLATNSFIGGGKVNNIASAFSTVAGGKGHTIDQGADFGAIAGGQANTIAINNQHSFIGGGQANTIIGNCSAILGGSGNLITHDWAGAFGCGVTSAFACAFHVNQLVAPNTLPWGFAGAGLIQTILMPPALVALGLPATACLVLMQS